jgi:asparagine synthetase A
MTLSDTIGLRLALSETYADLDSYRVIALAALAEVHRLTRVVRWQRESLRAFINPNLENDEGKYSEFAAFEPDDEATT